MKPARGLLLIRMEVGGYDDVQCGWGTGHLPQCEPKDGPE